MLKRARAAAEVEGLTARCRFVRGDLMPWTPNEKFAVAIGIGLFDLWNAERVDRVGKLYCVVARV
jgi:hypothetical protein